MTADFPIWKKAVFYGIVVLAAVGLFDALQNLPVVSNCAFYADCAGNVRAARPDDV